MSGLYPDVPGPRMAWDRDGSAGVYLTSGVAVMDVYDKQVYNDESNSGLQPYNVRTQTVGVIFPEPRDLVGIFAAASHLDSMGTLYWSPDTTTGSDGAWNASIGLAGYNSVYPTYRTGIQALALSGVRGVKFTFVGDGVFTPNLLALHLYGSIHAGETPNRLRLWKPLDDAELDGAYFDWGDVPRGSSEDRDFRVKNNSAGLTAHGISISHEILTNAGVSLASQFTYSFDGSAFAGTVDIGDLGPGAISDVITVRRTTPSNADLSVWALRIIADPASWS